MNYLDVNVSLRTVTPLYPSYSKGPNCEEFCSRYLISHRDEIDTSMIYIPVHWWNNTRWQSTAKGWADYTAVPESQGVLDRLDPAKTYFTVSQADEGPYERMPPNVVVFNAGGWGDIPIPLLADPHTIVHKDKVYNGCFLGNVETGGPKVPHVKPIRSSWDKDGPGARVRRAMWEKFKVRSGYYMKDQQNYYDNNSIEFCEAAWKSRFGLAPRGYGKTSFRLYEYMTLGTIPVYIYDEPWLPYLDRLDWTRFAVLCHVNWINELADFLERMPEEEQCKRLHSIEPLYNDFFSMTGLAKQVIWYVTHYSFEDLKSGLTGVSKQTALTGYPQ